MMAARCPPLIVRVFVLLVVLSLPGTLDSSATATPTATPAPEPDSSLEPGLVVEQRHFTNGAVAVIAIDMKVDFWGREIERIATRWSGKLQIKQGGNYTFEFVVDGGAKLEVDSVQIVGLGDNGTSGLQVNSGSKELEVGYYPIVIMYEEVTGDAGVILKYSGPDTKGELKVVPEEVMWHVRGPCDLMTISRVTTMPCDGRWALASGEECVASCEAGYFAIQREGVSQGLDSSLVSCLDGELTPKEICAPLYCAPPTVPGVEGAHCLEGPAVPDDSECTPVCPEGQIAGMEGPLVCHNGTLSGSWFDCHQPRACTLTPATIPHAKLIPCSGIGAGLSVASGQKCTAQCEDGYEPSTDPVCTDGQFPLKTATSPPFDCSDLTTTTATTSTTEQLTAELTAESTAGSVILHVSSVAGFDIGDTVRIVASTGEDEWNTISSFGSIILTTPLDHTYGPGTTITKESVTMARRRRSRRRISTITTSSTNLVEHVEELLQESDDGPPWHLLAVLAVILLCCALTCVAVARFWSSRQNVKKRAPVRLARRSASKDTLLDSEDDFESDEEYQAQLSPPPSTAQLPPSDKEKIISASWKPGAKVWPGSTGAPQDSGGYAGAYAGQGTSWSDVSLQGRGSRSVAPSSQGHAWSDVRPLD